MKKTLALSLLGGSEQTAATHTGLALKTVQRWPEVLNRTAADRVIAAVLRQEHNRCVRLGLMHLYPDPEFIAEVYALPPEEVAPA
jgi:hypothetical protein